MYLPQHFAMTDPSDLQAVIGTHPFATLVTATGEGINANHLPLLLNTEGEQGILRGHIARANPLWRQGMSDALAIFHGPQAYITPSWYPDKQKHGRVVPTWNYQVVHAHGTLRFVDDPTWLKRTVAALSNHFEQPRATPWSIEEAPDEYIEAMCRAIVGIELTITRLTGKLKASQHKTDEERAAIHHGLQDEYAVDAASAACLSGMQHVPEG